jgi:hypothetical protein
LENSERDITQFDGFFLRRNLNRLTTDAHVDRKLGPEGLLIGDQETRLFFDDAAHMVSQSAVGV